MKTEDWNDRYREDPTAAKRAGDNARKWEKPESARISFEELYQTC